MSKDPQLVMAEYEHLAMMSAFGFAIQCLRTQLETAHKLVAAARTMESAGIVIDPTLLRNYIYSDSAQAQVKMAELVIKFVADFRELAVKAGCKLGDDQW